MSGAGGELIVRWERAETLRVKMTARKLTQKPKEGDIGRVINLQVGSQEN